MPPAAKTDEEFWHRFWSKVDRSGDCWLWTGALAGGYGSVKRNQRVLYTHRLVLEITLGRPLVAGEEACHTCDCRQCVRPDHLFLGSATDNNRDCAAKYRGNGRQHSPVAKLTDEAVILIRERYAAGTESQQALADQFGVSQMTISKIVRGVSWKRLLDQAAGERRTAAG